MITRELILGLWVAAEKDDEAGVTAGDVDLDDTVVGERSRKDVVDDSRSLEGILDFVPVDEGVWCDYKIYVSTRGVWKWNNRTVSGVVESVSAFTRDTGDPITKPVHQRPPEAKKQTHT